MEKVGESLALPDFICLVRSSSNEKNIDLDAVPKRTARCRSLPGAPCAQGEAQPGKPTMERGVLRNTQDDITLHTPTALDGFDLHALVEASPPLDPNSVYCNLLQCTHFQDTSIGARKNGKLVGFVSGYRIPSRPDTLFIWQVAVDASVRGQGLASRMLHGLLDRPACGGVEFLETTITPSNTASQALFARFAERAGATLSVSDGFDRDAHFKGRHDSEQLYRIGPLNNRKPKDTE